MFTNKIKNLTHNKKAIYSLVLFFFFLDLILLLDNFQNKTPIIGLRFEGKPVSFYKRENLKKFVEKEAKRHQKPLVFSYKEELFTIDPRDIGYKTDSSFLTNKILLTGRQGDFFKKISVQIRALMGFEDIKLSGNVSQAFLTLKILQIKEKINKDPIVVHPDFKGDLTGTISSEPGLQVDSIKFSKLILKNINHPSSESYQVPMNSITPRYHSEIELDQIRNQAKNLTKSSVSIVSAGEMFTLQPEDLKSMLMVVERPDPANPKKTKLLLHLNDKLLNQKLGVFAARVEAISHAEFNDHDARSAIYSQFYSGNHSVLEISTFGKLVRKNVLGEKTVKGPKTAYLTFDDGPNQIYHPLILDILKQYNIKATFFLVGQNVSPSHDVAVRTFSDGHLVGNHSFTHSFLPKFSSAFISNELLSTNNTLFPLNQNKPIKFFRPPYGGTNSYVVKDAHDLGLRIFLWDVDPRDWAEPSVDELVGRVVGAVHDGSDILMHSSHLVTARALPRIIETLQAEEYTFKTLDSYPISEQLW